MVSGLGEYSLSDTLECGQCFRAVRLTPDEDSDYCEYLTVVDGELVFVAERERGELIFFTEADKLSDRVISYFALDVDWSEIRKDIERRTDSEFLRSAAKAASGIRILRQSPWEALFSFIVSQNNNIPRIKKIIRSISAEYGENLAVASGITVCPLDVGCSKRDGGTLDVSRCAECGICYTFPTPEAVAARPEGLLPSHPGFRFKYLTDAAHKVVSGEIDLKKIASVGEYSFTLEELQ